MHLSDTEPQSESNSKEPIHTTRIKEEREARGKTK